METTIGSWGNSEAIRLPQAVLRLTNLRKGDRVSLDVNQHGNIEIVPIASEHRCVAPKRGVSFESLFKGYGSDAENPVSSMGVDAWPNDDLFGAEWDAWAK